MTRQRFVNIDPAPGVVGARASMNPVFSVAAGRFSLTSGALGVAVGKFAWNAYATAGGPGVANNYSPTAPAVPDGFVSNEQQGLITTWLNDSSLLLPAGLPITEYYRGDFWAKNVYAEAALGQKIFANLFSGDVLGATTGSFPVNVAGTSAAFTASVSSGTNTLNVTALTSGNIQVGQQIVGVLGNYGNNYIESLGTGTGAGGTYYLSQNVGTTSTSLPLTSQTPSGIGGATMSATANWLQNQINVVTVTSGAIAVGQLVQATGIPTGTYVASLGTSTGGLGTVNLSANLTATITNATVLFSSWIETPFSVLSPGNVGDLIKIGLKS